MPLFFLIFCLSAAGLFAVSAYWLAIGNTAEGAVLFLFAALVGMFAALFWSHVFREEAEYMRRQEELDRSRSEP